MLGSERRVFELVDVEMSEVVVGSSGNGGVCGGCRLSDDRKERKEKCCGEFHLGVFGIRVV